MTILIHDGSYQGYPIQACKYRRSPGLREEYGEVIIDMVDLKGVGMEDRIIGWRGAGGVEVSGGISIQAWWEKYGKGTRSSPKRAPEIEPEGGKFGVFGDLVMNTTTDGKKMSTRFTDVYLAKGAIEELTNDLANVREHKEGQLRVGVTDIRSKYQDYGWILCDINVRYRSGAWKPSTIKAKEKQPFSAREVIEYLFSQLPGSPQVVPESDWALVPEDPPTVLGRVRAVDALEQLLDRMGLVPALQPSNHYAVWKRGSNALTEASKGVSSGTSSGTGDAATHAANAKKGSGGGGKIPHHAVMRSPVNVDSYPLAYEQKLVYYNERPPLVGIIGLPRCCRTTLTYVPCFQDEDKRIYRLEDIDKVWGYSLTQVNASLMIGNEKAYRDVPPAPGKTGGHRHFARKAILRRCAYKMYAPAAFFEQDLQRTFKKNRPQASGTSNVPFVIDTDFEAVPYLPMMDMPVWGYEAKGLYNGLKSSKVLKGDLDDVYLLPPAVYGSRLFQNFFAGIAEIEDYFTGMVNVEKQFKEAMADRVAVFQTRIREQAKIIQRAQGVSEDAFQSDEARAKYRVKYESGKVFNLDADLGVYLDDLGAGASDNRLLQDKMEKDTYVAIVQAKYEKANAEAMQEQIEQVDAAVTQHRLNMKKFKDVYAQYGGVQAWFNSPWTMIEDGAYTLDAETGIITFQQPMVLIDQPFILDTAHAQIVGPAAVTVTFGYERKSNNVTDLTLPLYMADTKNPGPNPDVWFVGFSRSSPAKMKAEFSPDMRLYETEMGTPMNMTSVVSEGLGKASSQLKVPRVSTGYVYEIDGFVPAVLDPGVDSVQYMFDGDIAKTEIAINGPMAKLDLGPGRLGQAKPWNTLSQSAERSGM